MTRGPHWDDQKVESRLKELPYVKDEQTQDELFEAIQEKIYMSEEKSRVKTRKSLHKKQWFFPTVASVAAVFILLLIIPSFLTEDELSSGNNQFLANQRDVAESESDNELPVENDESNSNMELATEAENDVEVNVKENEHENENSVEMAREEIIDEAEEDIVAIPYVEDVQMGDIRAFHIMVEGIARERLGDMGETKDELLFNIFSDNNLARAANIEGLQGIEIDEAENAVTLDFSSTNRLEGLSSSETAVYSGTIREILSIYGYEKVHFTTNGEPGIMFGQTGFLDYSWDLPYENRGYYLYRNTIGEEFFLRGVAISEWSLDKEGELTFSETLEHMKNVKEDAWYEPTIPEGMQFDEVRVDDDEATITLTEDSPINEKIIETIRLAASDFSLDYVTIINERLEEVGQETRTIKIPVYPIPNFRSDE